MDVSPIVPVACSPCETKTHELAALGGNPQKRSCKACVHDSLYLY